MPRTKVVNNIKYILGTCDTENHLLIKKAKPDYFWFHVDKLPSAHCIVETNKMSNEIKNIAANYIKKYSKCNKVLKVSFCYTTIGNVVLLDKPGAVTFKNMSSLKKFDFTNMIVYHYSDYKGGNAAEYIVPDINKKTNIDITSHGIGSGIYGLSRLEQTNNVYAFTLESPLLLETIEECDKYIEASKYLQRTISKQYSVIGPQRIALEFIKFYPELKYEYVLNCIKQFMSDFKNRTDMVMMPINYIMMGLGYDGVYSKVPSFDTFSKGNIVYTGYPTKKEKYPVSFYKKRCGAETFIMKYE